MHILLVEDDLDISSNLKVFLESKDYLVTVSNTIKNAQANIKYTDYDLMILDITLPDGNGIEFYKENNTIPTIFLSAKDDEETIRKMIKMLNALAKEERDIIKVRKMLKRELVIS